MNHNLARIAVAAVFVATLFPGMASAANNNSAAAAPRPAPPDVGLHLRRNGSGCGIVFKLVPHGSGYIEHARYRFQGGNDGNGPLYGLLFFNGLVYGTTAYGGGPCNCGTVFSIRP